MNLPAEMRSLAEDLDIPLIDLTALTEQLAEELGVEASKDLYLAAITGRAGSSRSPVATRSAGSGPRAGDR